VTWEIGFLFALLAVMVVLFLTEKLPVDLTAFIGLSLLVVTGMVKPEEAFTGFASPAVITMLSVFFVSAGLQYTGVAASMGQQIHRVVGSKEVPLIIAVMLVAGILSAFMNNIAAAAVLMPAVVSLARQASLSPSRLLMPLAFGAILGGTTTLVGTPPNLLTAQVLSERGLRPFELFDFAPFGLAILAAGTLFMATIGRKLLPAGVASMADTEQADLSSVYNLEERLFCIRLPSGSPLIGRTLAEAELAKVLGVQVVSVGRAGQENLAPSGDDVLREGDRLVVEGGREDLEQRLQLQGLELGALGSLVISGAGSAINGILVRVRDGSPLAGKTLRQLNAREHLRVNVIALWRAGAPVAEALGDTPLAWQDELLALGEPHWTNELAGRADLDVVAEGQEAIARLEGGMFLLQVPEGSSLAGGTVAGSRLRERLDLTIAGLIRAGEIKLITAAEDLIQAGDQLIVSGQPNRIAQLLELGNVEVGDDVPQRPLESREVGLVEVVVAPRSAAVGHSLRELSFRKRYGLRALALWRDGGPVRSGLPDLRLRLGDGLLLHGRRDKVDLLRADPDFVVLKDAPTDPQRTARAPFAIGALLLMVILVVLGLFPIQVAAFFAATLVVLTRALKMREAYEAVEWRAIFLVAAILPVGIAMERTGAAQLLADSVSSLAGGVGPYGVLVAMMLLSSLLSQGLDGAPTVVLLGPVVVSTAEQLGLSPYPLMMGVGLAASAAFMTPFSHKANLLVMGAGGYRAWDYVKVGTPLTVIVLGILALMLPLLMPFDAALP